MIALFESEGWRRFAANPLSLAGMSIVVAVLFVAVFAPFITPYPKHAAAFVDILNASQAPSAQHLFGTDVVGRDLLTRVIFGYRVSLLLSVVVLVIAVPIGVTLGLVAGYFRGLIENLIMRVTDVFLAIPPLVLAMAIIGFLEPTLMNAMIAVSAMWWPWYTRLIYNMTRSIRTEDYVAAAQVVGSSKAHILFREILPNCGPSLLTKMTLDFGFVILIASSLSFLGLGVQPPTPDLGSMVADGGDYLPDYWWLAVFPGIAILLVVLGFNLLGDGLRDVLDVEL